MLTCVAVCDDGAEGVCVHTVDGDAAGPRLARAKHGAEIGGHRRQHQLVARDTLATLVTGV